jgi:predicted dienelactone hydrolase
MVWSRCAVPPQEVEVRGIALPGVKDCPISGDKLPLVVISHGTSGSFIGHHGTADTLADAGFIVAAINHPGDTSRDMSRSDDLAAFVERPTDIKRLIEFMLQASPVATKIDPERIGFFGFSRGGYTGLVLIGANPDWAVVTTFCEQSLSHACEQVRRKEFPTQPFTRDTRIEAAVIADPLTTMFSPDSYAALTMPVQLWQSERGGDAVLPQVREMFSVSQHIEMVAVINRDCRRNKERWARCYPFRGILAHSPAAEHDLPRPQISHGSTARSIERPYGHFISAFSTVGSQSPLIASASLGNSWCR